MEKIGYIISELPVFLMIGWFARGWVRYQRRRRQLPQFDRRDRALLLGRGSERGKFSWLRLAKLLFAVVVTSQILWIQFYVLHPLGAAILSTITLLSVAAVVYRYVLSPH